MSGDRYRPSYYGKDKAAMTRIWWRADDSLNIFWLNRFDKNWKTYYAHDNPLRVYVHVSLRWKTSFNRNFSVLIDSDRFSPQKGPMSCEWGLLRVAIYYVKLKVGAFKATPEYGCVRNLGLTHQSYFIPIKYDNKHPTYSLGLYVFDTSFHH